MSFNSVVSASVVGLGVDFLRVEADVSSGLPMFHMVGYLSSEVREASERVRTAIRNMGVAWPAKKIIVNLSPAWIRKKGNLFDLPIAMAVLLALEQIPYENTKNTLFVGELGLDGTIFPVEGVLAIVLEAKKIGITRCVVPYENAAEGALTDGIEIVGVRSLEDCCRMVSGGWKVTKHLEDPYMANVPSALDFSDIRGQDTAKRALTVAVAGRHNILMIGPPGSGKTMLAKRIPTILPPMTREESLELTRIYSASGKLPKDLAMLQQRPFREVHHTATRAALLGGGATPVPGEVTLAQYGVLFLDELAEFRRPVIEGLRQPLEERCVRLCRTGGSYEFPADFMLVAATNPCPCGCFPDPGKCNCTPYQIRQYFGKMSQAFLSRIDLCVEVENVTMKEIRGEGGCEDSSSMRSKVEAAREVQKRRFAEENIRQNGQMDAKMLERFCRIDPAAERFLIDAYSRFSLSARSYHKLLKVSRTIADLDGSAEVKTEHIAEALGYRLSEDFRMGGGS